MTEGNNISILCKFIRNIAIRWDSSYFPERNSFFKNSDKEKYHQEPPKQVFAEVLVQTKKALVSFKLPRAYLEVQIKSELTNTPVGPYINQSHPCFVFTNVGHREENHINNMKLSFNLGRGEQPDMFPSFIEECQYSEVNRCQIMPTSPVYEMDDSFLQIYTTCTDIIIWEARIAVLQFHQYEVTWPKKHTDRFNPKHSAYSISLFGAKMFMSNIKLSVCKFFSDVSTDTFRINGGMQSIRDRLYLYHPITQKYKIQNECNLNNYFWIHQPKVEKPLGLLIESRLTTPMQEKLCNHEKFFFLEQTIRNLINMVPDEKLRARDGMTEIELINKQLWQGTNHLQRLEILGGHPFLHFAHNNVSVIESLFLNASSGERQRNSLFDILFLHLPHHVEEIKEELN